MPDKYLNKYRIPSARLKNWDYRNDGAYFITICTKNRTHFFGKIENGKMQLSEIGEIAHQNWAEIPQHFPFVQLDAFIIMPNHTHGILIINKNNMDADDLNAINAAAENDGDGIDGNRNDADGGNDGNDADGGNDGNDAAAVQTLHCNVSIRQSRNQSRNQSRKFHNHSENIPHNNFQMQKISPKSGSISTIIRSYKSATTKMAKKMDANFGWQTRFHDHIIRNDKSFNNIHHYIINNPKKWADDKFLK